MFTLVSNAIVPVVSPEIRRDIIKLAVPVSLENMFQIVLGFVNQVIVGVLGTATIAAVGLANNLVFIGILCLNTLGSGCAILASRALGAKDDAAVARISSLSLAVALGISGLIALPLVLFATPLLLAVGARPEIAQIGGPFLSVAALMLPPLTLSIVASSVFRAIGQPRLPMLVTMVAVALTPALAWVLVMPLGMGALGAAWASVVTQVLRCVVLLGILFFSSRGVRFAWPDALEAARLLRTQVDLIWPLFMTEVLFSGGLFLYALLVERLGTPELAAHQIVNSWEMLFISASFGLNAAATILVARAIGQADEPSVWKVSGGLVQAGVFTALTFGALCVVSALLLPSLFPNTTAQVQSWAFWAIVVNAVFQAVKVCNMIFFGVLSSGGDTKFLLLTDVITVFAFGLPVAYLLAFPLGFGFWGVVLGRLLAEETVRVGLFFWRYRQGRWFKLEPSQDQELALV